MRTDSGELDITSPPFDQFSIIQRLTSERRGNVSPASARHILYVGRHKQNRTSLLIKLASKPGLVYQQNLNNEIASLTTINAEIPESRYFPFVVEHGKLSDGRVYLVSSFFSELPLAIAIGVDRIPAKTVTYLRTALEIATALAALHRLKIFHVDLNPMNVLLRQEQSRPIVKIVDFESSYELSRHGAGEFYNPPTTPCYSAPEIPAQAPDGRADTFSLGALLYTMLAGYQWTWKGEADACLKEDAEIDPDLKDILLHAVDPNPANRYPRIERLHADLTAHLETIWPGRTGAR